MSYPFVDLALARRLERAEADGSARFVEARARAFPDLGACWTEVAGAYAMFDGVDSPITQTFGLGIFETPTAAHLDRIEAFFFARGAATNHEVSPLAPPEHIGLLTGRGYRPIELSNVVFRPIAIGPEPTLELNPAITVRRIGAGESDLWIRVAIRGWMAEGALAGFFEAMAPAIVREGAVALLAEIDGEPIAAGAMSMFGGVALLAGACTVPEARNRGAQLALLDHRLRLAAAEGCDLAMMAALPGSASQRNAERHGFRVGYTRTKWTKDRPTG